MSTPGIPTDAIEQLSRLSLDLELTGATSDVVYRVLSEAIITGILPPGQRLMEEQIAAIFSVSRTPIREALLRLESEHFAQRIPRRGLVVSKITPQDVIDVYVVREAIDGLAASLAAENATPSLVSNLTWINDQFAHAAETGDTQAMVEINLRFHEEVARAANSSLLMNIVKQIHHLVRRFQSTTFTHPGRAQRAVAEHRHLIEAISARNPRLARQIAESHMATARAIRIEMINESDSASDTDCEGPPKHHNSH